MAKELRKIENLKHDIPALTGDVRANSHAILGNELKEGQQAFADSIIKEQDACLGHVHELLATFPDDLKQQFKAAFAHRDWVYATETSVGFSTPDGEEKTLTVKSPVTALYLGEDPDVIIGEDLSSGKRFYRDGRTDAVTNIDSTPADDGGRQMSLLRHLEPNPPLLYWLGNGLFQWKDSKAHLISTGSFETAEHRIRQSLDLNHQRLAFGANRSVQVIDLRRILSGGIGSEADVLLDVTADHPVGGVALLENSHIVAAYYTQPATGEIYLAQGPQKMGLSVDDRRGARQSLRLPLLDGNAFTLEFCYRLPAHLPAQDEIPLVGGAGFPCIWLSASGRSCRIRWEFAKETGLETIAQSTPEAFAQLPGTWLHFALTYEDGEFAFYRNGKNVLNFKGHPHSPLPLDDATLALGNFLGGPTRIKDHGRFAEVRAWNRARTTGEIASHFATWIVASKDGLPDDLVLYHRFSGPEVMGLEEDFTLTLLSGSDCVRPSDMFAIPVLRGDAAFIEQPFAFPNLFWKTANRLSDWIATDGASGLVAWGEQFPDGQWWLMQAPAAGHLAPVQVRKISAWTVAQMRTRTALAGDILVAALAAQAAFLRDGYHLQYKALAGVRTRVDLAYAALFRRLEEEEAHRKNDSSREEHEKALEEWMQSKNELMHTEHEEHLDELDRRRQDMLDHIAEIRRAEQQAIEIRQKAQVERAMAQMRK